MADFILTYGIQISLICGALGLVIALALAIGVARAKRGGGPRQGLAQAVEQGGHIYQHRQGLATAFLVIIGFCCLEKYLGRGTGTGFLLGALSSWAANYLGLTLAVFAQAKTAHAARSSAFGGLRLAFNCGAVTGLLVVGLALTTFCGFYFMTLTWLDRAVAERALIGLALGTSLVSLCHRIGGGIFTGSASLGIHFANVLMAKLRTGSSEHPRRNPATGAGYVGDQVGHYSGKVVDLYETLTAALLGALLLAEVNYPQNPEYVAYPFLLSGLAILASAAGILLVNSLPLSGARALPLAVLGSGLLSALVFLIPSYFLFGPDDWPGLYAAALIGLILAGSIMLISHYTSRVEGASVQKLVEASEAGPTANILAGLTMAHGSTWLPVAALAGALWLANYLAGPYGISIAAVGMLSLSGIILSLVVFSPVMAGAHRGASPEPSSQREAAEADRLGQFGRTIRATSGGYAIVGAALTAVVLLSAFVGLLQAHRQSVDAASSPISFELSNPSVLTGLFIGASLPFFLTSWTMGSVATVAGAMMREVERQFTAEPRILSGEVDPDYAKCLHIGCKGSLWRMFLPVLLPVAAVVIVSTIPALGAQALAGLLGGALLTGLFLALSLTNAGSSWENGRKSLEGRFEVEGTPLHQTVVTGDTVGDPLKDAAGPALTPLIKVIPLIALLVVILFF